MGDPGKQRNSARFAEGRRELASDLFDAAWRLQDHYWSCWAAAVRLVLIYYKGVDENRLSEAEMVDRSGQAGVNGGGTEEDLVRELEDGGVQPVRSEASKTMTFPRIVSEIESERPLIVATKTHTLVATGYNAANTSVLLRDPAGNPKGSEANQGRREMDFNELQQEAVYYMFLPDYT